MGKHDDDELAGEVRRASQLDETVAISRAIRAVGSELRPMAIVMAILHADNGDRELADAVVARYEAIAEARMGAFLNGYTARRRDDPKA